MSGGKQMIDKKIEAIRDLARIIYAEEQTLRAQDDSIDYTWSEAFRDARAQLAKEVK